MDGKDVRKGVRTGEGLGIAGARSSWADLQRD